MAKEYVLKYVGFIFEYCPIKKIQNIIIFTKSKSTLVAQDIDPIRESMYLSIVFFSCVMKRRVEL